ncbi:MAG: hypothetical protein IT258_00835 [Saprospiraceae bacterium]|nr:hypothetical protein [Saprospiraceae bacterium]
MNSENFHEYVKNPSMLHQVSYQELKSLVLQYPYSPNLRYLLLLKSLLDQSKDFDRNQILASLSSPDRKKLRNLVKQYTRMREMQENYALNEEFLELKDLSVLENLVEEPNPANASAPVAKAEAIVPPIGTPNEVDEEIEEESDLSFLQNLRIEKDDLSILGEPDETPTEDAPTVSEQPTPDAVEEAIEIETAAGEPDKTLEISKLDNEPTPMPAIDIPLEITNEQDLQPVPKPRSSFNSWLKQFNPPQAGLLKTELKDISLNNRPHQPPVPIVEEESKQIEDNSVEEDEEIASETLALLLEKQRLFSKAISMYQRLQLKYPEKSGLFAAKIEELNRKLNA